MIECIKEILAKPIATKNDIEDLAGWLWEEMLLNEEIANENQRHIDTILRLRDRLEWYRTNMIISVK